MAKRREGARKGSAGKREGEPAPACPHGDRPAFSLAPEGPQEEKKIDGTPQEGEAFFTPKAREAVSLLLENLQDPGRLEGLSARETLELARELLKEIRLQEEHERGGPGEEEGTSAEELTALDKKLRRGLKEKGYL